LHIICVAETETEAETESEYESEALATGGQLTLLTVFWVRRDKNPVTETAKTVRAWH